MGEANYHHHVAVKFLEGRVREAKREKVLKEKKNKKERQEKWKPKHLQLHKESDKSL